MGGREGVVDHATQYADEVIAGTIVAGQLVRLACERHRRDLEQGPARGLTFHAELAERAVGFIECLRHYEGVHAGKPFKLSLFQKFIVGSLFGWYTTVPAETDEVYNAAGLFRRFRTGYIEIAKGNGKTPLAAAIGLYGLAADGEMGAEVYSAATGRDQAKICFRDAMELAGASKALRQRLVIGENNIAYPAAASYFRPVSSEGRGLDGKRPHIAIIDELHEHPSPIVVNKMKAGTKGRTRPLILEITNSGYDKSTVCWEHHDYSVKVLQGVIANDAWFAFVAALDEEDEPFEDEACWPKANPNLGVSVTAQYLRTQVREASEIPSQRSLVLRLNFCRWTEASENWGDLSKWELCAEPAKPGVAPTEHYAALEASLAGRRCYGGIDLASVSDICAKALVFPPEAEGERWKALLRFWLPEQTIARRVQKARLPYDQWTREGWIRATTGNVTDYAFIKRDVLADKAKFDLREVAIDRWNATHLTNELQDEGVLMVLFGQGFASMSAPMKELERLYTSAQLEHGANPVLRWMFSNVVSKTDPAGNIKPDRAASTEKIDGIVALIMALGRAMAHPNQGAPTEVLFA